jgi:hypothetical protein
VTWASPSGIVKIAGTAVIPITLSKAATDFAAADITVTGGGSVTMTGSGTTYSATYTPPVNTEAKNVTLNISSGVFTDATGNYNFASSTITVAIDTLAPNAPVITGDNIDVGTIYTNQAQPIIGGTSQVGATVKLYKGTTLIGSSVADAEGNWLITVNTALTTGSNVVTATATDAALNTSASSGSKTITLDTTAPNAPIITATNADAGAVANGGATNDQTIQVVGTAEANSSVTIFNGTTLVATGTANGSGAYSITTSSISGSVSLTAKATDKSQNVSSASTARTLTIDIVAPTVSGVAAGADQTYVIGDVVDVNVTFTEAVTVALSGSAPTITLETGTIDRVATYVSGSGTTTLLFRYTVQPGDASNDLDYVSTTALALGGATFRDAVGNSAVLTLGTPGEAGSMSANSAAVLR